MSWWQKTLRVFRSFLHYLLGGKIIKIDYENDRRLMVKEQLINRGIADQRLLDAFLKVPRHRFVQPADLPQAYDDHPLSIGSGQTISQPYMVACMLESLALKGSEKVLEIGTGSGYQTALLAELVQWVYTIERISELLKSAETKLNQLGYQNISFKVSDGTIGWKEYAPFERIIVSAGAPQIPHSLVDQLTDQGIMVIPVGSAYVQDLIRVQKKGKQIVQENRGGCVFVKLIGKEGW